MEFAFKEMRRCQDNSNKKHGAFPVGQALIKNRQTAQGQVTRMKIVMLAAAGKTKKQTAVELGVGLSVFRPQRPRWDARPAMHGQAAGLCETRVPTPRAQSSEQPVPKDQARELKASTDAVWRVLRREGICLRPQRSWCVSTDPEPERSGDSQRNLPEQSFAIRRQSCRHRRAISEPTAQRPSHLACMKTRSAWHLRDTIANLRLLALARIQFHNELLVAENVDLFTLRLPIHGASELFALNGYPVMRLGTNGEVNETIGKRLGAWRSFDGDHITRTAFKAGDVH